MTCLNTPKYPPWDLQPPQTICNPSWSLYNTGNDIKPGICKDLSRRHGGQHKYVPREN